MPKPKRPKPNPEPAPKSEPAARSGAPRAGNEKQAETPDKARTREPMPFDEAQRQALLWIDHLRKEVERAQPGQELAHTYWIESRVAELTAQLGLWRVPITRRSELVDADGRPIPDDAEPPQGATVEHRRWVSVTGPIIGDWWTSRYHGHKGPRKDGLPGMEGTRGGTDDEGFRDDLLRDLERWRTYIESMSPPTAETLALAVNDWHDVIEAAEEYRALLAAFQADAANMGDAEADARMGQAEAAHARLMTCMKRFDLAAQPPLETARLYPGAKYVNDDRTPRPFKTMLADALARIEADMLTLRGCLNEAETTARRAANCRPSAKPIVGAKQQPWTDEATEYMLLSEAIAKLADGGITLKGASKKITDSGAVRFMRKGRRCKVNIVDFIQWWKAKPVTEAEIDRQREEIEKRKAAERTRRKAAGG